LSEQYLPVVLKTQLKLPTRIHLFDFDVFFTHNAFRAPGAPSLQALQDGPTKAAHLHSVYSRMHRGIVPHEVAVDESNVSVLNGFDFVFLCVDDGAVKGPIVEFLEEQGTSFADVGIGVELQDEMLGGVVRTTTSTPAMREHLRKRVSMAPSAADDAYASNIQIAELNALNACMAVIRWKKLVGFYRDLEFEHSSTYTIDGNLLLSEDVECG